MTNKINAIYCHIITTKVAAIVLLNLFSMLNFD